MHVPKSIEWVIRHCLELLANSEFFSSPKASHHVEYLLSSFQTLHSPLLFSSSHTQLPLAQWYWYLCHTCHCNIIEAMIFGGKNHILFLSSVSFFFTLSASLFFLLTPVFPSSLLLFRFFTSLQNMFQQTYPEVLILCTLSQLSFANIVTNIIYIFTALFYG